VAIDGFQVAGEGVRQGQRGQTRWGDGEEKEGDRPPKAKPEQRGRRTLNLSCSSKVDRTVSWPPPTKVLLST
jgi:hypothetical protein